MLRVSTSTTTLLSSKEACRTLVPAVQLGMTSTVLAGDLALNDAAPPASLATHSRSLLRSAASHGSSVSHTSRTSENGDSIPPSPIQDSQLEEDPSSTSDDTISGALDMLDENVLPIKSQITLRKVYGVFKLLTLLRFCSMLLQPATNFSDTFPYMPVDNAGMKSTKAQINFSELPIVALFLHGSIFSFATWVRRAHTSPNRQTALLPALFHALTTHYLLNCSFRAAIHRMRCTTLAPDVTQLGFFYLCFPLIPVTNAALYPTVLSYSGARPPLLPKRTFDSLRLLCAT